jgi:hypothetical protein
MRLRFSFVGDQQVRTRKVSVDKLRQFSKPIIPVRTFMTGERYPLQGFLSYNYFYLPGHSIEAVSLQGLVRRLGKDGDAQYLIELVRYDGEALICTTMDDRDTFLLLPPYELDAPLFLACPEVVSSTGTVKASSSGAVAFGVKTINVIKL